MSNTELEDSSPMSNTQLEDRRTAFLASLDDRQRELHQQWRGKVTQVEVDLTLEKRIFDLEQRISLLEGNRSTS